MKKSVFVIFILLFLTGIVKAQTVPPSADMVLKKALQEAVSGNKNVLIIFHASWCGWCHKMDSSIKDPSCKEFFDNNFIIRHLVVSESPDKKRLENPGAEEMKTKYHGRDQGIPFWLIFDKEGNLLADSKIRKPGEDAAAGENTGCPASEKEVDNFISILQKTTDLNLKQLDIIKQRFRKNEN